MMMRRRQLIATICTALGGLVAAAPGIAADEILGVPDDFYAAMGLAEVVTPMRLRGMHSILCTIKRQIARARTSPG